MGATLGEGVCGLLRKIFVPEREEVTGGRRRLHNEALYDPVLITRVTRARRLRWAGKFFACR